MGFPQNVSYILGRSPAKTLGIPYPDDFDVSQPLSHGGRSCFHVFLLEGKSTPGTQCLGRGTRTVVNLLGTCQQRTAIIFNTGTILMNGSKLCYCGIYNDIQDQCSKTVQYIPVVPGTRRGRSFENRR
jgi:hypothetical protein